MIEESQLEYIGSFGKPHGYKGEINLAFSQFRNDEYLKRGFPLIVKVEDYYVPFYVKSYRPRGNEGYLVTIEGADSDREVKPFSRVEIFGLREQVLETEPDFMLQEDMVFVGAEIYGSDNVLFGIVTNVDESTDNILLTIEKEEGEEVLMPFDPEMIIAEEIDEDNGRHQFQLNLPYEYFQSLMELNRKRPAEDQNL